MSYETILVETRGPVTLITLNRPQSLNALNSVELEDLIAAFAAFEGDPSQRCAVLTGAGELVSWSMTRRAAEKVACQRGDYCHVARLDPRVY